MRRYVLGFMLLGSALPSVLMFEGLAQAGQIGADSKQSQRIQRGDRRTGIQLNDLGELYRRTNRLREAREAYQRALEAVRLANDVFNEGRILENLGRLQGQEGDFAGALATYQQALRAHRLVNNPLGEAETLSRIAEVYRQTNQPELAIANIEQSFQISVAIRPILDRNNLNEFLNNRRDKAVKLINLLIDQKKPDKAYEWANLQTSADLADYSRAIGAKVADPQAQKALDTWQQANQQLQVLRDQLRESFSSEASQQANRLQVQLNRRAEEIAQQFPDIAELFAATPVEISQLQANLPPGTVVLQPAFLTETDEANATIALFVVTPEKVSVTRVPVDAVEIDQLLNDHRNQLQTLSQRTFRATGARLYDLLIRPVEAQIQTEAPKQLSIVATGKLRYIPLETLYDSQTRQYLIQKYAVNNLTRLSRRVLSSSNPSSDRPPLRILALGNPFPEDQRNLPGAEIEVQSITPLIPGSMGRIRRDATLATFRNLAPEFSVLHIATHGCFVAGGCPNLGMAENTILFADENLDLATAGLLALRNANLVTLSACQTAIRTDSNGQEFAGIAYLFERGGARSVVASLWDVDDIATKQLMINFYSNLSQGMTKGEALRRAKLELISQHPYYWSSFILIGDHR